MTDPLAALTLFDSVNAAIAQLEQATQTGDLTELLRTSGGQLAQLRRATELTIENGDHHVTCRFRPWAPKAARAGRTLNWLSRAVYASVLAPPSGRPVTVGVVRLRWPKDATPDLPLTPTYEWQFDQRTLAQTSQAQRYACHVCYLTLSGVDVTTERWTDARGVEMAPTDAYLIRQVTSCLRCGIKLTQPSSIDQGFGPDCAEVMLRRYIACRTRALH